MKTNRTHKINTKGNNALVKVAADAMVEKLHRCLLGLGQQNDSVTWNYALEDSRLGYLKGQNGAVSGAIRKTNKRTGMTERFEGCIVASTLFLALDLEKEDYQARFANKPIGKLGRSLPAGLYLMTSGHPSDIDIDGVEAALPFKSLDVNALKQTLEKLTDCADQIKQWFASK